MSLRKPAARRPQGTDGSDFSYRMVVDQRYLKVAEGKSLLCKFLITQAIYQLLGVVCLFLRQSHEERIDNFTVLSLAIGFLSLFIGELGRRRSQVILLRLYSTASSMATALSVVFVIRSEFFLQAIRDRSASGMKLREWVDIGVAACGVLLQVIIIITTTSLVQNMSLKRSSR